MDDDDLTGIERRRPSRRTLLVLSVAGGTALVAGAGFALHARVEGADEARAGARQLAQDAYARLREGDVAAAFGLAQKARELDPESREARSAWLHATGMHLIEGDADAGRATGLVYEARALGFRGAELAFATLAAAVAMKNDRFARLLLEQHREQDVGSDAYYHYAKGAALDLDCDPAGAEASFTMSAAKWHEAVLPRLRRARSLVFDDRTEDARTELEGASPAALQDVLIEVIERLETGAASRTHVEPGAVVDMPRSLRPLAHALMLGIDGGQVALEAALADVDTPLAAIVSARVALTASDRPSAERAARVAHEMRPEHAGAAALLVELELQGGDLPEGRRVADVAGDPALLALVRAISAYEDRRLDALRAIAEESRAAGYEGWKLLDAARGMLGDGPAPDDEVLAAAAAEGVVWADMLLVDKALAASDTERAKKLMAAWPDEHEAHRRRKKRVAESAPRTD